MILARLNASPLFTVRQIRGSSWTLIRVVLIVAFVSLGTFVSYYQPFGLSPDYKEYATFFDLVRQEGLDTFGATRFEPVFSALILVLTHFLTSNISVFSTVVACCLLSKAIVISASSRSSYAFVISGFVYLSCFFPLHELTQLRVAVATSLVLIGAMLIWRTRIVLGTSINAFAVMTHYSSSALISLLYLRVSRRWKAIGVALLVYLVISTFSHSMTTYLEHVFATVASFGANNYGASRPNPFNASILINIASVVAAMIYWDCFSVLMKQVIFIQLVSIATFYGFVDYPVFAFRISEMMNVTWILFIANGITLNTTRRLSLSIAGACSALSIYLFYFRPGFFSPI